MKPTTNRRPLDLQGSGLLGATLLCAFFAGCSGGGSDDPLAVEGSAAQMDVLEISTGFGQLIPHTIRRLNEFGQATGEIIEIRSLQDLTDNLSSTNPIRRLPQYSTTPSLPNGDPGNHFIYARFTRPPATNSVLDPSGASPGNQGLSGAIRAVAVDPSTGDVTNLSGVAFLGGKTYAGPLVDGSLELQTWVERDANGNLVETGVDNDGDGIPDGRGFPGVTNRFDGSSALVRQDTVVFVADSDGDLTTYETFPTGAQIQLRIETGVLSIEGKNLQRPALGSTTVGADTINPEVSVEPLTNLPKIIPGSGEENVDPLTNIEVRFTEPVQPFSVGSLPSNSIPTPSSSILVEFGPPAATVQVPFAAEPISVYDLSRYRLIPAYNFPGRGPDVSQCGTFSRVDVSVVINRIADMSGDVDAGTASNMNTLAASTFFETAEGPGIVNAPVSPDTVYIGITSGSAGLSVIDMNGFGGGTGNPMSATNPDGSIVEGSTNFPNNPNVRFQGASLIPPLTAGTCTVDGGSAGVFTLALDSSLNDLIVADPLVNSVDDIMIGQALDVAFNNGPAPFGCQAAGGNLCAFSGLKLPNPVSFGNTVAPAAPGQFSQSPPGSPNLISWAPHPNPPPLQFPPLCVSPNIGSVEPTSITTAVANLLVPGDAFGIPQLGVPPSGIITPEQNAHFLGPSTPLPVIGACPAYMIRQQVGHFLYIVDRGKRQVLILNSNRMTVIDRIVLPDPTSLAMSPNLDLMAVSNQTANLVSFIDINPSSSTFHQVVQETSVGLRPRGIAWEPDNEDILVCNEGENSISVIGAGSLEVRKTVASQLSQPFDLAITPRQAGFGFQRNVYFAWILNRNGRLAIFESGPNGTNGWGYDDIIGIAPQSFRNPKAIQPDHIQNLVGAVWIVHEGPIDPADGTSGNFGEGAVSNVFVESAIVGALPLNVQSLLTPQFRDLTLAVRTSLGEDVLSGIPTDVAFDNLRNWGALPNFQNFFSVGATTPINGKNLVRPVPGGAVNTNEPRFMFVAVPSPNNSQGVVDVFDLIQNTSLVDTNPYQSGFQSIPSRRAAIVSDYWRQ